MKISNTMHIKNADGNFEDVKISYMKPNGCAEEGMGTYASGSCTHAEGGNTSLMWKGGIYLTGIAGATNYTVTGVGASSIKKGDLIGKSVHDTNKACVLKIEEDQIILDHTLSKTTDFNAEAFGVLEGFSKIVGRYSHGEGYQNVAFGEALHAEGYLNTITGDGRCSHIEGYRNTISGDGKSCHAEGSDNKITHSLGGHSSHIEGMYNIIADGSASLATASHVSGIGNECRGAMAQTIIGKYNEIDSGNDEKIYGNYSFIVGNGTSNGARSNAHTLDWNGNAAFAGDIKDGEGNILRDVKTLAETKVSGISSSIVTGSHVYNGSATDKFSFVDENVRGKSFIICGTQDAGNPVLRAYINENTITVDVSSEITNMRVNYICF